MTSEVKGLRLDEATALLVLTGAGVSAESGLPTYRGTGGLWRSLPFERLASPEGFRADPALVWRFYSERREAALRAQPNAGHVALVDAERRLGEQFSLSPEHRRAPRRGESASHADPAGFGHLLRGMRPGGDTGRDCVRRGVSPL